MKRTTLPSFRVSVLPAKVFVALLIAFLPLTGCGNPISSGSLPSRIDLVSETSEAMNSVISSSVLSSLLVSNSKNLESSPLVLPEGIDEQAFTEFVNNPRMGLSELADTDEGHEYLDLIHSIYTGGDAGTVRDKMALIDPDMALKYESQMNTLVQSLPEESSRAFLAGGTVDLSNIALNLEKPSESKGCLAADWEWDTVYWYVGFCAATTAGLAVWEYTPIALWFGIPKYAGLAAAIGGAGCMTAQLYQWYTTEEGQFLVNAAKEIKSLAEGISSRSTPESALNWAAEYIKSKGIGYTGCWNDFLNQMVNEYFSPYKTLYSSVNSVANYIINRNEFGGKLLLSATSTVVPVVFCCTCCQDLISTVANWITSTYNSTVGIVLKDINLTINGVPVPSHL
jgi:hypothetical protein